MTVTISGRHLQLSNLEKVLYPEADFTKAQVLDYYVRVADALLPHLRHRPITLKRYPNGVDGQFFYEKRCPSHKPDWVPIAKVWSETNADTIGFCVINDRATLMWVANLAAIELHTYLYREDDVTRPTTVALDFDPGPGVAIVDCARLAMRVRDHLDTLGLVSFPKTSGGKGFHLYVPLNTRGVTFEETKSFARELARRFEKDDPQHITANMRKDLRPGRIFIDWSQNDDHKTTVCVYSLRARPQPTASTPLTWAEVESAVRRKSAKALTFEAEETLQRIDRHGDLFAEVLKLKQKLPG